GDGVLLFFFSSRRRHTRFSRDWSSDVCSSDLALYPSMYNRICGTDLPMRGDTLAEGIAVKSPGVLTEALVRTHVDDIVLVSEREIERAVALLIRSEERRVGKECGSRVSQHRDKIKMN